MKAFTFGQNWLHYSRLLNEDRVKAAGESLQALLGAVSVDGWSVLDVGCGSGLFSIACIRLGARRVLAIDCDTSSVIATRQNVARFLTPTECVRVDVRAADILRPEIGSEQYDLVYAWGSLHHTGSMWRAIENALTFCKPHGLFVIAIYNATWLSPAWLRIKRAYHGSPVPVRLAMAGALTAARAAVRLAQFKHPLTTGRGMNIWYDAVDWLGGLPYEFAAPQDVCSFMGRRGSICERSVLTRRLGCNEFVFRGAPDHQSVLQ
jgi:2-polyprenyl-6-hydroxyphenyl methylase/3-demethylubiquinone-9 3-methyltransferase